MTERIILFDGVCNLCNGSVQFVIAKDKNKQFSFASLQSSFGQNVLRQYGLPTNAFHSFLLLEDGTIYTKSTAALRVVRSFGGAWSLLYVLNVVPYPIRDFFYNIIARNRYKWFGKQESCWLPSPELKVRFL